VEIELLARTSQKSRTRCTGIVSNVALANADWSHTVLFGGVIVSDANRDAEPTAQAIGESGLNYSAPIRPDVPEATLAV
jgi:hypothetical protein